MRSVTKIVDAFDQMLQSDVEILYEKKVIRKGTFILYTIKDFIITVIIKTPTSNKTYDIYYPFDATFDEKQKQLTLDYTFDILTNRQRDHLPHYISDKATNKFLNKRLLIKFN